MTAHKNEQGDVAHKPAEASKSFRDAFESFFDSMRRSSCAVQRVTRVLLVVTGVFAGMLLWSRLKIVSETPRSAFADPKAERAGQGIEADTASGFSDGNHQDGTRHSEVLGLPGMGSTAPADERQELLPDSQLDDAHDFVIDSPSGAPR